MISQGCGQKAERSISDTYVIDEEPPGFNKVFHRKYPFKRYALVKTSWIV